MSAVKGSQLPPPADPAESDGDDTSSVASTSSSEDVTEDEDGAELTPALDAAIMRTLGMIKRKEGVYGKERVLEEAIQIAQAEAGRLRPGSSSGSGKLKAKPFLLSDHHRKALLEGVQEETDAQPEDTTLTTVQANAKLRAETLDAFKSLGNDSEEDEDGEELLLPRKKDEEDEAREAEEYRHFLLDMGGGEEEVRRILGMGDAPVSFARDNGDAVDEEGEEEGPKTVRRETLSKAERAELEQQKRERKAKKAKDDDDFLMNYILNRGWIDRSADHVPTYDEITAIKGETHQHVNAEAGPSAHPWGDLEEDAFDDKADQFEAQYNFRFEEPGASEISTHPRLIASVVRRGDDARKSKRAKRAERKAAELAAQGETTKAKKGKKRREVVGHLEALKEELGEGVDWEKLQKAMEGDWDEGEWERVVGDMLEKAAEQHEGKPEWEDEVEDAEYDETEDLTGMDTEAVMPNAPQDEEVPDGAPTNMDADFIGFGDEPATKKQKKNKKDKKRKHEEEAQGPGQDLTVAERSEKIRSTMDEYKALDHEDMIGDLPTRFKYTQSEATSFGLTPAEILLASDAELNSLVSVKHIAPYRSKGLGPISKGINQKVKVLRAQLKKRNWGDKAVPKKSNALEEFEARKKAWKAPHLAKQSEMGERAGGKEDLGALDPSADATVSVTTGSVGGGGGGAGGGAGMFVHPDRLNAMSAADSGSVGKKGTHGGPPKEGTRKFAKAQNRLEKRIKRQGPRQRKKAERAAAASASAGTS